MSGFEYAYNVWAWCSTPCLYSVIRMAVARGGEDGQTGLSLVEHSISGIGDINPQHVAGSKLERRRALPLTPGLAVPDNSVLTDGHPVQCDNREVCPSRSGILSGEDPERGPAAGQAPQTKRPAAARLGAHTLGAAGGGEGQHVIHVRENKSTWISWILGRRFPNHCLSKPVRVRRCPDPTTAFTLSSSNPAGIPANARR